MDAPKHHSKFLSKGNELGLVAVGFSGGQVRPSYKCATLPATDSNRHSASLAWMLLPWL